MLLSLCFLKSLGNVSTYFHIFLPAGCALRFCIKKTVGGAGDVPLYEKVILKISVFFTSVKVSYSSFFSDILSIPSEILKSLKQVITDYVVRKGYIFFLPEIFLLVKLLSGITVFLLPCVGTVYNQRRHNHSMLLGYYYAKNTY